MSPESPISRRTVCNLFLFMGSGFLVWAGARFLGGEDEERRRILAGEGPSEDRGYKIVNVEERKRYTIVTRTKASAADLQIEQRRVVKGTWIEPVNAVRTNVSFGGYNSGGRQPHHTGVDYAAGLNSKIVSVDDGIVHYFGWWPAGSKPDGHGLTLWIYNGLGEDGRPIYSVYAHLNGLLEGINIGKTVKQGEIVALSGKTGFGNGCSGCNTPHLHFAVARQWLAFGLTWSETNNPWDNPDNYFA